MECLFGWPEVIVPKRFRPGEKLKESVVYREASHRQVCDFYSAEST